jgi:RNA-directed DNA polymerase
MLKNNSHYKKWEAYFESRGVKDKIKEQYLLYIKRLLNKNVPIIFNLEHLSLLLGRKKDYLSSVVNSPDNHYRKFKIKKRSGGFRDITTPYPALLEIQYWIYDNILKTITFNSAAHGFTIKKSIITNSKIHAGEKQLLKIDLKDFFPSIKLNRVIFIFKELGYPNIVAFYLSSICCYEESLPQGAPTSPVLSNIVARKLDNRLINLSKKFKLKYTRYADDLTFSGNSVPAILIKYITKIVTEEGFQVNETKTRLYRSKSKRIVTGVSVIDKEIKLPRKYKRSLKQELHYIFKYGLNSHMSKKKIRKSNYLFSIAGKVNFWLSIEPKNKFALDAKKKLKNI